MGERYWITGVQLGMLQGFVAEENEDEVEKITQEIVKNQFLGHEDTLNEIIKSLHK
jgi:hypothetical protein